MNLALFVTKIVCGQVGKGQLAKKHGKLYLKKMILLSSGTIRRCGGSMH